ncbi:MAG: helix-turn-helix transcriptional regulator [Methylophilaceae bacterium]
MPIEMLRQVLNQLGQATVVVSHDLDVVFLSTSAQNILDQADGLLVTSNRLQTSMAFENRRLKQLLDEAIHSCAKNGGRSPDEIDVEMYISRPSMKQPLHLRMMPVVPAHPGSAGSGQVIILIRDLDANCNGLNKRLQDNFHLTPRECECAVMLAEGLPLCKIATQMAISEQTIRLHLKHMFIKMNVSKQHELVAKLLHLQRMR